MNIAQLRATVVLVVSIVALVIVVPSSLGASSDCGTWSFGFAGTRLINDGISNDAGPFAITLPAGTYDVTMVSHDNHPSPNYQPTQTGEQWYFKLDSGYTSGLTKDVPSDAEWVTTTASRQVIGETTAISVHHAGAGGVNSVNVICVGFTPSPAQTTTTAPGGSVAPSTTDGGGGVTTTVPGGSVAPSTTDGGGTVPPASIVSVPPPDVKTPTTTAPPQAPGTTAVPVEVKPAVELPGQLARTGLTSTSLVIMAVSMLASGGAITGLARRREDDQRTDD